MRFTRHSPGGRARLRVCSTVAAIAATGGLVLSGAGSVTASALFSATDAAESFELSDPSAVGADAAQQQPGAPSVTAAPGGFGTEDATVGALIPKRADEPITVSTPSSGALRITPHGVSENATSGQAVNDGAAVVYGRTGEDSDTSVVPLEKGIETFTNIRSESARENYSVTIDLDGDEQIVQLDDHSASIIDPTPTTPGPALPEAVQADSVEGAKLARRLGVEGQIADPDAGSEAERAAREAGVSKPTGAISGVTDEQREKLLRDAPTTRTGDPTEADRPTALEAAQQGARIDREASARASERLADARRRGASDTAHDNAQARRIASSPRSTVATIEAPDAVDADGNPVKTRLTVAGDVITLHVDHKGEDVKYPVAADPIYDFVTLKWRVAYTPIYRTETYVSGQQLNLAYVADWHPAMCGYGWLTNCTAGLSGWWNAYSSGVHHAVYWPSWNWGPAYRDYYTPIYATRQVVDHYNAYWEPYLALSQNEVDVDYVTSMPDEITDANMNNIPVGSSDMNMSAPRSGPPASSGTPIFGYDPAGQDAPNPGSLIDPPPADTVAPEADRNFASEQLTGPTPRSSISNACRIYVYDPIERNFSAGRGVEGYGFNLCWRGISQISQACIYKKHSFLGIPTWKKAQCGKEIYDRKIIFRPVSTVKKCQSGTGTFRSVVRGSIYYNGPQGPGRYIGGAQSGDSKIQDCN